MHIFLLQKRKLGRLIMTSLLLLVGLTAQAQDEYTVIVLDNSDIINNSYNAVYGSNGIYITTPDGTPPANNVPYYLWPGGVQEAIDANVQAVVDATAPSGAGAWQGLVQPANDGKVEILIHPHEIFGNGTYTLSDINSITWQTNKPGDQTQPDWYINIWLDAGGGNVAFLSGEPYWANSPNAPVNTWNTWTADDTAGGTNEIRFHEPGFACTNFGWGAPYGPMPTLDELIAGPYMWNNVLSQNFLPGCTGTPNPLTTTINYSGMPILGISIATGNPWAGSFTGSVDNLNIALDHPSLAGRQDMLIVDFEAGAPASEPDIAKAFAPTTVAQNGTSTLTFTLANSNDAPIGDISFTDNLPVGMEVANPPNVTGNTCEGIITATAGASVVSLSGGLLPGAGGNCNFSVNVVGTSPGALVNISNAVTTTTLNFPTASGGITASATLTVNAPPTPTTVTVSPSSLQGWGITDFPLSSAAEFAFVTGAGTPPLGTGSLEGRIPSASTKLIFARTGADYSGTRVADLTGLSYSTYNDPTSTNTANWYINLYIDANGDNTSDCRLDYAPSQATLGTWQNFNAFTSNWSGSGGGCPGFNNTLATFVASNPNAVLLAFSNPAEPAIRFNMGDTSTSYVGYVGNIDNVRIATTTSDTTWDFEPDPIVPPTGSGGTGDGVAVAQAGGGNLLSAISASSGFANLGDTVTWVITLNNTTGQPLNNANINIALDNGLVLLGSEASSGNISQRVASRSTGERRFSRMIRLMQAGGSVAWSQGSVGAGETITITLTTRVRETFVSPILSIRANLTSDIATDSAIASVLLVTQLPATGETPAERDLILLALMGALMVGGTSVVVWRRRVLAH